MKFIFSNAFKVLNYTRMVSICFFLLLYTLIIFLSTCQDYRVKYPINKQYYFHYYFKLISSSYTIALSELRSEISNTAGNIQNNVLMSTPRSIVSNAFQIPIQKYCFSLLFTICISVFVQMYFLNKKWCEIVKI